MARNSTKTKQVRCLTCDKPKRAIFAPCNHCWWKYKIRRESSVVETDDGRVVYIRIGTV